MQLTISGMVVHEQPQLPSVHTKPFTGFGSSLLPDVLQKGNVRYLQVAERLNATVLNETCEILSQKSVVEYFDMQNSTHKGVFRGLIPFQVRENHQTVITFRTIIDSLGFLSTFKDFINPGVHVK